MDIRKSTRKGRSYLLILKIVSSVWLKVMVFRMRNYQSFNSIVGQKLPIYIAKKEKIKQVRSLA